MKIIRTFANMAWHLPSNEVALALLWVYKH